MHKENPEKKVIDPFLEKKAKFFDELSAHFYNCNFGTCTKSEIDLLMFHFYCELHRNDPKEIDSYTLSKTLGITQERIRNLKVKEYLTYPRKVVWDELFTEELKSKLQYNETNRTIEIPILDPTVFMEIEHRVETNGGCVRYVRNKKILSLSLIDFSKLLVGVDKKVPDEKKEEVQQLIERAYKANKEWAPYKIRELLKKAFADAVVPPLLFAAVKNFIPIGGTL